MEEKKRSLLALSLKELETLVLQSGDKNIEIGLQEIKSNQVRLIIKAPKEVEISRSWGNKEVMEESVMDKKARKALTKREKRISKSKGLVGMLGSQTNL